MSVSEAEGAGCIEGDEEAEAEVENTVLDKESDLGMELEMLQIKKKDGFGRRDIKGKALRSRVMFLL